MSYADTDHLIAAEQALAEAKTVLSIFEGIEPDDRRPRLTLEALSAWMKGNVTEAEVRQAAFDANGAARDVADDAAKFAAKACGQAASVAHTPFNLIHVTRFVEKAKAAANAR
jgi:hypothetical protein